jgi:DNA-binding response OmpR family regulator
LVLAGPKVVRLLPFLEQKGFVAEAFQKGSEALNRMRQAPCHLLLLELECGDTMGIDLARGARQEGICGAALLVDDPMKSGMIISALARGIDAFVATPPDETIFFARIETMLLAQWGLVVTQQQAQLTAEIERLQKVVADADAGKVAGERRLKERTSDLEKQLAAEKKKVADLEREASVLRDQLATMHLVTGAKTGLSDEGHAETVDFLLDDPPPPRKPEPAKAMAPKAATATPKAASTKASMPAKAKPTGLDLDHFDNFDNLDNLGDLGSLGDLDELEALATAAGPSPTPTVDVDEDSTQDIPAHIATGMARSTQATTTKTTGTPALADFGSAGGIGDLEHEATMALPRDVAAAAVAAARPAPRKAPPTAVDDVHTMAMPADLARSLVESVIGKKPAAVNDARTMAMSADEARALVAEASRTSPAGGRPQALVDEAPTLAGLGTLSLEHTADFAPRQRAGVPQTRQPETDGFAAPPLDDFDAPTAAVSITMPNPKPSGRKEAPKPIDSIFDEPTPAAGLKGPPLPRSMSVTPAKTSGFDRRPGKPPALDSQVVKDLAQIPSLDSEEILFLDDD